jgi:hypothetical protein
MTTANGTSSARTARKSLADQIDRLDGILDGLAEALNESVAEAVKDVIGQAVHAAVSEVLASPDLLRAALERHSPASASPAPPPPRPEPPTPREDVARIAGGLRAKVKRAAGLAKDLTLITISRIREISDSTVTRKVRTGIHGKRRTIHSTCRVARQTHPEANRITTLARTKIGRACRVRGS